ncbi:MULTISPECIES: dihydrodipicolinate synthase family protein [Acetobacter]|uniref:Dihydrodipicolinate synthase family protein n=2 Tax=Acetobacter TaxID=434 RepID=A0AAN1U865_9PROT|nr:MULTISPECIES: dihydrodipicolinate synthase family protein [Acetobacter]ASL41167.1 dihydrodipicolinate synthase family protein [Acetobacter oryzifermentans]AXM99512.1 dihydrodipicolinate synthase family protein [Acetobacter pomorum]KAA8394655.1 dihydrodipicolinate synthase family protein [Acetobacter sp. DmW_125127]KAA8395651.1 dihydrodipicolinate synthase family protein [Acetobacter sp. DmW_125124]KAA8400306.1 dihydrodipicolinate synthase family protein [Acetobacter sp. DmW_125128]
MKFTGVSAFPITPMNEKGVDQTGFERLITRLVDAGVDSIGVQGSTGNYPYLTRDERVRFARVAVDAAQGTPVVASIGAFRTRDVLSLSDGLQNAGVSALLLPVVAYHGLREEEVFTLYKTVSENVSVPVILYDSPGISRFEFSDDLYARICVLPRIGSVKIPSGWPTRQKAQERLQRLIKVLPATTVVGVSGDETAAAALRAGAKIWYSEWGGIFPRKAKELAEAALTGDDQKVAVVSQKFEPFWEMSRKYGGSLRPICAVAFELGLTDRHNLPLPMLEISDLDRGILEKAISVHGMD